MCMLVSNIFGAGLVGRANGRTQCLFFLCGHALAATREQLPHSSDVLLGSWLGFHTKHGMCCERVLARDSDSAYPAACGSEDFLVSVCGQYDCMCWVAQAWLAHPTPPSLCACPAAVFPRQHHYCIPSVAWMHEISTASCAATHREWVCGHHFHAASGSSRCPVLDSWVASYICEDIMHCAVSAAA